MHANEWCFIVVCGVDPETPPTVRQADFILATRTVFRTVDEARKYASGISAHFNVRVVAGRFGGLRDDVAERFGSEG